MPMPPRMRQARHTCKLCSGHAHYFVPFEKLEPWMREYTRTPHARSTRQLTVDGRTMEGVYLCTVHSAPLLDAFTAKATHTDSMYDLTLQWAEDRVGYTQPLLLRVIEGTVQEAAGVPAGMGAPKFVPGLMLRARAAVASASTKQVDGTPLVAIA